METSKLCVICKKEYEGDGHDARPIRAGLCCDVCYFSVGKLKFQREKELRAKGDRRQKW